MFFIVLIYKTNSFLTVNSRSIVGIIVTVPFDLYPSYDAAILNKYLSFKLDQLHLFCFTQIISLLSLTKCDLRQNAKLQLCRNSCMVLVQVWEENMLQKKQVGVIKVKDKEEE